MEFVDDIYKKDENIVYRAISKNGLAIKFVDDTLKKDMWKTAYYNNPLALEFVIEQFLSDPTTVCSQISSNPEVLRYIPDYYFYKHPDLLIWVKFAFKKNGLALEFASDTLKDNEDLVKVAINQNSQAIRFASQRLQESLAIKAE